MNPRRNLTPVYVLAAACIVAILASCTFHGTTIESVNQRGVDGGTQYSLDINATRVDFAQDVNPDGVLNAGFRFDHVTIPQGTLVTDATLSLYYTFGEAIQGRFYVEAVDNSADFTTDPDLLGRARSVTSVEWDYHNVDSPIWVQVPVGTLIDELVARAGWRSGNALTFIFIACNCNEPDSGAPYSVEVSGAGTDHAATLDAQW
jgi:hypothetical protein